MIVTIDGPAGAGKSSVAKALATRLGFRFLDTGAMYRTVALALIENGWDKLSHADAAEQTRSLTLAFNEDSVKLNGRDVTREIRSLQVTNATRLAADNPLIRKQLVDLQRRIASETDVVSEGRDQGTVAFPEADCKIFLTASAEERARRRQIELAGSGVELAWDTVLEQINQRDEQDRNREVGRLVQADDAHLVSTDGLDRSEVVNRLEEAVRQCQKQKQK